MGRGKIFFTFIWVLSFGLFLSSQHLASSKELRREVTCFNDVLQIDCGSYNFIAIHEAYFTTLPQENQTCQLPSPEHEYIEDESMEDETSNVSYCYEDLRIALNRKCSGSRNCTYSYDEPERKCRHQGGQFIVRYDCVKDTSVNRYCNVKVHANEGYIASPGFPKYCPHLFDCSWSVEGAPGQTILLKILHLHTSPATEVFPTVQDPDSFYAPGVLGLLLSGEETARCDDDALVVLEGNLKRAVVCGEELQSLRTVEADAESGIELRLRTSAFQPTSGFLAYFKVQGCPTVRASEGSYLIERNGSAALYGCAHPLVFNDTLESTRFLGCIRDHHWNDTLPQCILGLEEATTTVLRNTSTEPVVTTEATIEPSDSPEVAAAHHMNDIIIPSILMTFLVVGNAIILWIIYIIRKRKKRDSDYEIEESQELKPEPVVASQEPKSERQVESEEPKSERQVESEEPKSESVVASGSEPVVPEVKDV